MVGVAGMSAAKGIFAHICFFEDGRGGLCLTPATMVETLVAGESPKLAVYLLNDGSFEVCTKDACLKSGSERRSTWGTFVLDGRTYRLKIRPMEPAQLRQLAGQDPEKVITLMVV
jgi:hypothetical protein